MLLAGLTSPRRGVTWLAVVALAGVAPLCLVSTASGAKRLTSAQFKAIDAAFTAYVPVDSHPPTASAAAAMARACRLFIPTDELLGALRPGCDLMVRGTRQLVRLHNCPPTRLNCLRTAMKAFGRAWQRLVERQAPENRVIDRVLSGPCRAALRTPSDDFKAFDLLSASVREFERATKTGSPADLTAWQRLLHSANEAVKGFRSAREHRTRFREACKPT